jgi:hypothetical protein
MGNMDFAQATLAQNPYSSFPRDVQRDCIAEEYVRETGEREKISKSRGRFRQSQWVV